MNINSTFGKRKTLKRDTQWVLQAFDEVCNICLYLPTHLENACKLAEFLWARIGQWSDHIARSCRPLGEVGGELTEPLPSIFLSDAALLNAASLLSLPSRPSCRHKKQKAHSLFRRARISLGEAFSLWKINLHELVLHVKGLRLTGWVWALLCWLLPAPH